jgi:hypothetical protein
MRGEKIPLEGHPVSDRIDELLRRNLQEVFGEADAVRRRAAIKELYTEDLRAVCAARHVHRAPGPSTNLRAIFVRPARTLFTSRMAGRRPSITPVGWLGGGLRGGSAEYTGLDVIIVRDGKIAALYCSLIPCLSYVLDRHGECGPDSRHVGRKLEAVCMTFSRRIAANPLKKTNPAIE